MSATHRRRQITRHSPCPKSGAAVGEAHANFCRPEARSLVRPSVHLLRAPVRRCRSPPRSGPGLSAGSSYDLAILSLRQVLRLVTAISIIAPLALQAILSTQESLSWPNHDPSTVLRWHIGVASTGWIVIRKS